MTIVQRKHDKWMVPATIGLIFTIAIMLANWGRWTSVVETSIKSNTNKIVDNRNSIVKLELNTTKSQIVEATIQEQLRNLVNQMCRLEENQNQMLRELKNGYGKE
jgi:hypothetical protein